MKHVVLALEASAPGAEAECKAALDAMCLPPASAVTAMVAMFKEYVTFMQNECRSRVRPDIDLDADMSDRGKSELAAISLAAFSADVERPCAAFWNPRPRTTNGTAGGAGTSHASHTSHTSHAAVAPAPAPVPAPAVAPAPATPPTGAAQKYVATSAPDGGSGGDGGGGRGGRVGSGGDRSSGGGGSSGGGASSAEPPTHSVASMPPVGFGSHGGSVTHSAARPSSVRVAPEPAPAPAPAPAPQRKPTPDPDPAAPGPNPPAAGHNTTAGSSGGAKSGCCVIQ